MTMYMSLQELSTKLERILRTYPEVDKSALIANAIVVQDSDWELTKHYAPGTILLNCIDSQDDIKWHQLSINPERISKWLN